MHFRLFLTFPLFLFFGFSNPQSGPVPRVPERMMLGDLHLHLNHAARKKIQAQVDKLRKSEKFFQMKVDRAVLYFPIIREALAEKGVPEDFAFLSIQESGLVSDAVSTSKAVGFWQLKGYTGTEVGLRINNQVDERKNIYASSLGAATYLKKHNFFFKNWIYSLTAYYAGRTGAMKHINEKHIGDKRMNINGNTHWYVLRFLAHKIAFENELSRPHSQNLVLRMDRSSSGLSLDRVAKKHGLDRDLVHKYNKWLAHGRVPQDREYTVILPMDSSHVLARRKSKPKDRKVSQEVEVAASGLTDAPAPKAILSEAKIKVMGTIIRHEVNDIPVIYYEAEDTLESFAEKSGVSISKLMKFNEMDSQSVVAQLPYFTMAKSKRASMDMHIASQGQDLWQVSQLHGVRIRRLEKFNHLDRRDTLEEGTVVWLNTKKPGYLELHSLNSASDERLQ